MIVIIGKIPGSVFIQKMQQPKINDIIKAWNLNGLNAL